VTLVLITNSIAELVIVLVETTLSKGFPQVLLSMAWLIGYCYLILMYSGKVARFQQTLTALLGTDIVVSAIAFPFLIAMKGGTGMPMTYFIVIGLMCWRMIIIGHILRHALSTSHGLGLGLALLYILGFYELMEYFFKVPV